MTSEAQAPGTSMLRVLKPSYEPVGAGFLVAHRHAICCVHTINFARGQSAGARLSKRDRVLCDFPFLVGRPKRFATVIRHSTKDDAACLRFSDIPQGSEPAQTIAFKQTLQGRPIFAFGFPASHPEGINARGVITAELPGGRVQVDSAASGQPLTFGFSGSPVVLEGTDRVVGMLIGTHTTTSTASALLASGETFVRAVNLLGIYESQKASWFVNWVRSALIPSLISDLDRLEGEGLEERWCEQIRGALATLYDQGSFIGNGYQWDSTIHEFMEEYYGIYREWNNQRGSDPTVRTQRSKLIDKLRKSRVEGMKKGLVLVAARASLDDVRICDAIHRQFGIALRVVHNDSERRLFPNTKVALNDYQRVRRLR